MTTQPHLILASTSPYRQEILKNAGITFKAIAPTCDEDALKDPLLDAKALTQKLAKAKALSLASQFPNDIIIGSDQVLAFEKHIFGKPKTAAKAFEQLSILNGKTHQLVTSIFICGPNKKEFLHTDITELTFFKMSDAELKKYIELDSPLDCAGSYKIEKAGVQLFSSIEGKDYHSIQGLPLLALIQTLRNWGIAIQNNGSEIKKSNSENEILKSKMLKMAQEVQKNSYAPYSQKHIASSIRWSDGSFSSGCNIENASYGATVCAERVAIWKGLAEKSNRTITEVLVLSDANPPWPPCGMCRQVISEFAGMDMVVFITNGNEWIEKKWQELFPMSFEQKHLSVKTSGLNSYSEK